MNGFMSGFPLEVLNGSRLSPTLWLENPAAERKQPRVSIAISFPMPHQSFVAATALSNATIEVLTTVGYFAGKGAIPCPAFIYNMEGAPQVTRQTKLGRRRGPEITVTDDRFLTSDTRIRADIVIPKFDSAGEPYPVGASAANRP